MIGIVSATRLSRKEFLERSPLGVSLRRLAFDKRISARVAFDNSAGLSGLYNAAIDAADARDIIVFIHDDVFIDDYFIVERLSQALGDFDVVGVAGNHRRIARQPAWAFTHRGDDGKFVWDARENLSGAVAHGKAPFGPVSYFGPAPAECELLDGVVLAARRDTLREHNVRFDPRFDFHLYDMDFCRSARAAGLRLGVSTLCVTHRSGGAFGTPQWSEAYEKYLAKWGD